MAEEDTEKELDPSAKKLEDARKKGDIPKAVDLATSCSYAGFFIACLAFGAQSTISFGETMIHMLEDADRLSDSVFEMSGAPLSGSLALHVGSASAPWLIVPGIFVLVFLVSFRLITFAPSKIEPKLSRVSPIEMAKQKYGRAGLFEFAKSASKLVIYGGSLFTILWVELDTILGLVHATPAIIMGHVAELLLQMTFVVFLISLIIGGLDYGFQNREHIRKNRMSRQEMKEELKNSEGDPFMRQARRQKGQEIALSTMLTDTAKADVIIVNPTHYAVALTWSRKPGDAPVCVAKGVDAIAARIREVAHENAIPIHRDPPTARALHASVDVGHAIHPEHYKAVAAAIRFAELVRQKAQMKGGS